MITCYITYEIEPARTEAFEIYAKAWIPLVERFRRHASRLLSAT